MGLGQFCLVCGGNLGGDWVSLHSTAAKMSSFVGVLVSDQWLQSQFTQVELRSLKSKVTMLHPSSFTEFFELWCFYRILLLIMICGSYVMDFVTSLSSLNVRIAFFSLWVLVYGGKESKRQSYSRRFASSNGKIEGIQ